VTRELQKLTVYFGERDRANGGYLADALAVVFARHELQLSIVLRATTGFGRAATLRTDRMLSLSEDLPIVTVAVDAPARVEAVLRDVERLPFSGLVTIERARSGSVPGDPAKLTAYVGRGRHRTVVATLSRHGVAGATALLGVDGTIGGVRRRAGLLRANGDVPVMVVSVGDGARIAAALAELGDVLHTVERVRVCRRDGVALAGPHEPGEGWQKLTVYTSEATGQHEELVRRARAAGGAGATVLRGVWGYHGDHAPHGDRLLQLRRRVTAVTVLADTPANVERLWPIVQDVTARTGLVTSERIPVLHERG
jgi:PII-like signaling protein